MMKKARLRKVARLSSMLCCLIFISTFAAHAHNRHGAQRMNSTSTVDAATQALEQQTKHDTSLAEQAADDVRRVSPGLGDAPDNTPEQAGNFENMHGAAAVGQTPQSADAGLTGVVRDSKGNPLAGVAVVIRGTTKGVATDANGRFSFTAADLTGSSVLVFTYLGMTTVEIAYTGQRELSVTMQDEATSIDRVVVSTGIFSKARESYTGAVTTITARELQSAGNTNLVSQIRNIDPSFMVVESNQWGSDPNRLPDIQMRGNTSVTVDMRTVQDESAMVKSNLPLFIVNGFEMDLQYVLDMDPALVETVTLLKDASATAMYGSRGSNGIVVIETKKPEKGRLRFSYKGDLKLSFPELSSYDLLDAADKLAYEKAAGLYDSPYVGTKMELERIYSDRLANVLRGVDTYWLKYPVRTGVGQRHSIRMDGGADDILYAVNLSLDNNAGVMKKSSRKTLQGGIFLQYTLRNFKFQNDLSIVNSRGFNSPYGKFSDYASLNPYWEPYDENGNPERTLEYTIIPNRTGIFAPGNPLYDAKLEYRDDSQSDVIQNNFAVDWQVFKDLSVRGRFRFVKQNGRSDKYISKNHSKYVDYAAEDYIRRGEYVYVSNYGFQYDGDVTVNYNKTINDKHTLSAGINFSFAEDKSESYTVLAEGYAASNLHQFGMGNAYAKDTKPTSSDSFSRRLGVVANASYMYDNKYFADFTGKLEGSSMFGSNERIAPFWSMGLGWNLHREEFMHDVGLINTLRLRASYGTAGSQNFYAYQAMMTFGYHTDQNYHHWTGATLRALGNENLKWQTTRQFNAGLEIALAESRFRINFDFYNKLTEGILVDISLPSASGFPAYKANMGEVRNRGFELSASAYIIRNTDRGIIWSAGVSMLRNDNKVLKISNALKALNDQINNDDKNYKNPSFPVEEGQSLNTIFAVKSLGIDPSTGQEIFLSKNGGHTFYWNSADRVACGVTDPKLWGNFNTMLRVKNFTLNVIFGYRFGGHIYNSTLAEKVENVDPYYNVDSRVYKDRWLKPGDHARFKGVQLYYQATNASSRFVMKENVVECRSINLSYEFNPEWLARTLRMGGLTVSAFTEDVFRLSNVRQERGTSYPFARSFSLSVSGRF